jgi:hypothetical protein
MVRLARRFLHTSEHYDGDKLFTVVDGRRALTPMLLVMIATGGTDILFALDSIPAIFGLTQNVYLVFTATAFSLLGLRQLYFLIDGLLDRLIHLSYGLAAILAFIGVKLILHALHENNLPFINDGQPVNVVEISTGLSPSVILGVLAITVVASLTSAKGRAQNTVSAARRLAAEYVDIETDPVHREEIPSRLLFEEEKLRALPEKHRKRIREEEKLMSLLRRAHAEHDALGAAVNVLGSVRWSPRGAGPAPPDRRLRRGDDDPVMHTAGSDGRRARLRTGVRRVGAAAMRREPRWARDLRDGEHPWLLSGAERGNDAAGILDWSAGNDVRALVDGDSYLPALAATLAGAGEDDAVLFVGYRTDPTSCSTTPGRRWPRRWWARPSAERWCAGCCGLRTPRCSVTPTGPTGISPVR